MIGAQEFGMFDQSALINAIFSTMELPVIQFAATIFNTCL